MKWEVEFADDSVVELGRSLDSGPILELAEESGRDGDIVRIRKQLVAQMGGLKIYIYANEHPPPHFHVKYGEEENSFRIDTAEPLYPDNGLKNYFKNIKKWHNNNKAKLVEK
jgi:hypothetical protein